MGVIVYLHRTVRLPKASCRKDGRCLQLRLSLSTVEHHGEIGLLTQFGERQRACKHGPQIQSINQRAVVRRIIAVLGWSKTISTKKDQAS